MLTGCTPQSEVVEGTSATVAVGEPVTSLNANTPFGSSVAANRSIVEATSSVFNAYSDVPKLVRDESFGSYELVSEDPLVVKYTIRDGVRWSDGTPVDAADMLLSWAANSSTLNDEAFDAAQFTDPKTGAFTEEVSGDTVYFDGFSGNGMQLVTQTPVIGDGGRSLTLHYDEYFPDWELVFEVGLPAHVVAKHALGVTGKQKAKDAAVEAIETRDREALAAISRFWNSGYNFTETPKSRDLLVGNGPYIVSELVAGESVTLTANPEYRGDNLPKIEQIVVRFISDPLQAVTALEEGEVDVVSPQGSAEVASALSGIDDVTVQHGFDGSWERLDLQFEGGRTGVFENPLIREAFLKTVPREEIVETLIRPVDPDAQVRSSHVFMPGAGGYESAVEQNGSTEFAKVDIRAAKRLLAEAAKTDAALAAPTVCLLFDPANPRRVAEFQLIKESAARAGFTVTNCSSPDWSNLLGTPRAYDAALYALRETNLAVSATEASFASTSTINNYANYANPAVDALFAELSEPGNRGNRAELLTKIDETLWTDFAGLPLYQFPSMTAVSGEVSSVEASPLGATALWKPWEWEPVPAD